MERENLEKRTARTATDLRNQLAQMSMASQQLEDCARDDEKCRKYLAIMNQGICRMLRIVDRMELGGRLGREKPELNLAPTDLGGLTADLGAGMESLLKQAGVELTVRTPEHLLAWVDEKLIRQLLLELVANGAGGPKGIRTGGRVSLTLKRDGDSAVYTVEDDGPGLPPEKLPFLFNSDGEGLPEWRQGGNGIALAHRIAVLHGGRLAPVCEAGRGLVVVVSIPLGQGKRDILLTPRVEVDRGGFGDVLVGLSHLLPRDVFAPGEYE